VYTNEIKQHFFLHHVMDVRKLESLFPYK
jgi:hypothetical protein